MKRILLSALCLFGISTLAINAQTWNFSTFTVETISSTKTVNGLTIGAAAETTVAVDANPKSIDGYSFTQRLKLGGAGAATEEAPYMPTTRFLSFPVTGNSAITVYGMSSSSSAGDRILTLTDGTQEIDNFTNDGTAIAKKVYNYTGSAATLYLFSKSGGINLYLLSVEAGNSSINSANADKGAVVSEVYYNLQGKQVIPTTKGLVIKKVTYQNGSVETIKSVL